MFRDYVCSPANPTTVYVVQQGDTLWRIAGRKLNDTDRWPEIADYNLLKKPYTIFVGQRLYLPKSQSASTPFPALSSTQGDQISCSMPASSDGSESQPAKEVHHASVKLKLDKDVPVLHLKFPGGECEIGFKGELEAFRNSPLPITITRDGVKVEYENSQKAWATPKFVRLFNSLGLSVDKNGALTIIGKTGMETEWYKGTFEVKDGWLKYEVEPKPVTAKFDDVTLIGNIGCWIKIKSNIKFDPAWKLKPVVVLTEHQIRSLVLVMMVATAGAAISATGITFGQFLNLVARGLAGAASTFMIILIPAQVLKDLNSQTHDPSDFST